MGATEGINNDWNLGLTFSNLPVGVTVESLTVDERMKDMLHVKLKGNATQDYDGIKQVDITYLYDTTSSEILADSYVRDANKENLYAIRGYLNFLGIDEPETPTPAPIYPSGGGSSAPKPTPTPAPTPTDEPLPSEQPTTDTPPAGGSDKIKDILETENHIVYINGYDDGTVRPDGAITRDEVAAIFYRLLKDTAKSDAVSGAFSDVADDAWYTQAVNYLAKIGVLQGYEDGTFQPRRNITRAEFAAIISRFDNDIADSANPFSDVNETDWAFRYIISASAKGWLNGYADGTFLPNESITRAEVVTVINRMLERKVQTSGIPAQFYALFTDLTTDYWAFADIIEASVAHEHTAGADGYEIWQ
jgi:hypothetical protein